MTTQTPTLMAVLALPGDRVTPARRPAQRANDLGRHAAPPSRTTLPEEVVSNQMLVAFGDADTTRRVIAALQSISSSSILTTHSVTA